MAESWSELSDRITRSPPMWTFTEEDAQASLEYVKSSVAVSRVLCVASGGDVGLSMALSGARDVTVVDIGAAQLGAAQLKVSSVQELPLEQVSTLWLTRDIEERLAVLRSTGLDDESALGWLASPRPLIDSGVMQGVGSEITDRHGDIEEIGIQLCDCADLSSQRAVLASTAGLHLVETVAELRQQRAEQYFGARDDDPASDQSIRDEMKALFVNRLRLCLSRHLARENEFIQHQLFGSFRHHQPLFLDPAVFREVKAAALAARWMFVEAPIEQFLQEPEHGYFDCIYLSNVTDLMSVDLGVRLLGLAGTRLSPGGVVCHRCFIRPVVPPTPPGLRRTDAATARLTSRDRSFLYGQVVADQKVP